MTTAFRLVLAFYLRWRVRALAYFMLLEDVYPPFGDAPYPASIEVADPVSPRDRVVVGLRILLVIPHVIVRTRVIGGLQMIDGGEADDKAPLPFP